MPKIHYLIKDLLNNPNYKISPTGFVWTRFDSRGRWMLEDHWRLAGSYTIRNRGNRYAVVGYKGVNIPTHKIVYAAFKGELIEGMVIDHLNGDKLNNSVENLEQVSQGENVRRFFRKRKGESQSLMEKVS